MFSCLRVLVALGVCSFVLAIWPVTWHDEQRTGISDDTVFDPTKVSILWNNSGNDHWSFRVGQITTDGDLCFVTKYDGRTGNLGITAIRITDGATAWQVKFSFSWGCVGNTVYFPPVPTITKNSLVLLSHSFGIVALNTKNGTKAWEYFSNYGRICVDPLPVTDNQGTISIYAMTTVDRSVGIIALNSNGVLIKELLFQPPNSYTEYYFLNQPIALNFSTLLFGFANWVPSNLADVSLRTVTSLDSSTVRQFSTGSASTVGLPGIHSQKAFYTYQDYFSRLCVVKGVDMPSGKTLWTVNLSSDNCDQETPLLVAPDLSAVIVTGRTVINSSVSSTFIALEPETGNKLWIWQSKPRSCNSNPVLDNKGQLYFVVCEDSSQAKLYILAGSNGKILNDLDLPVQPYSVSLSLTSNILLVNTPNLIVALSGN